MKVKKIIMIIVLIVFIGIIWVALVNINKKSVEKINEVSQGNKSISDITNEFTTSFTNSTNTQGDNIETNTETVKIDINNMVEITDNFFIEQTNDLYLNLNDYIGKTIKIEGLIYSYADMNGDKYYAVVRNTPGCCGNDGLAGLDIRYDKDYPEINTWVEVIGVVKKDIIDGSEIPAIQVASLNVKEEGAIFVTN